MEALAWSFLYLVVYQDPRRRKKSAIARWVVDGGAFKLVHAVSPGVHGACRADPSREAPPIALHCNVQEDRGRLPKSMIGVNRAHGRTGITRCGRAIHSDVPW